MKLDRQPADNERNINNTLFTNRDFLTDNRTGVIISVTDVDPVGTSNNDKLLTCTASHVNDPGADPPTVVWTRNGVEVVEGGGRFTIQDTTVNNRLQTNLQISNFAENEAGIYQCIFTDLDTDAELATSTPYRLDYGQ